MESYQHDVYTYVQKYPSKISAALIYRLLFFGCFFAAILLANIGWKSEASWIGYLNENSFIQQMAGTGQMESHIALILKQRLPYWLILVCFSQTVPGLIYAGVFAGWQGISFGFIFSAMLARYGIRGIAVFAGMCFPQFLIYLVSFILMYRLMLMYRRGKQEQIGRGGSMTVQKKVVYLVFCVILSAVFLCGIFAENYVNPYILNQIVKIL